MRGVGSKLSDAAKSIVQAREHAVQCFGEVIQFVAAAAQGQTLGQIARLNIGGGLGDLLDGSQGTSAHPIATDGCSDQQQRAGDECRPSEVVEHLQKLIDGYSDLNHTGGDNCRQYPDGPSILRNYFKASAGR